MAWDRSRAAAVSSMVRPPKKRSSTTRLFRGSFLSSLDQGVVEGQQLELADRVGGLEAAAGKLVEGIGRRDPPRFWAWRRAGFVDQDAAHQVGGQGVEVDPVVPLDVDLHQPQIGFGYQGGRLQGQVAADSPRIEQWASLCSSR